MEPFELDIVMPVLDGYGTLAAIKADGRLSHLPVIITPLLRGPSETELGQTRRPALCASGACRVVGCRTAVQSCTSDSAP